MLKLSPQPHVPLMFGLLKTNSLESLSFTKSISVPSKDICAFASIITLTPAKTRVRLKQLHRRDIEAQTLCIFKPRCLSYENNSYAYSNQDVSAMKITAKAMDLNDIFVDVSVTPATIIST